jgi:hypothetical protein
MAPGDRKRQRARTPAAIATLKRANDLKSAQLGMPFGTAMARLRKSIMFEMAQELKRNTCFHCKTKIETIDDFSIEHKGPWQRSADPVTAFFGLNNISFSHFKCNIGAAFRSSKLGETEQERNRKEYLKSVETGAAGRKNANRRLKRHAARAMAAGDGIEPSQTPSKSAVLPLNEPAMEIVCEPVG